MTNHREAGEFGEGATMRTSGSKIEGLDALREEIADVQYWLTNSRMAGYEVKAFAAAQTIQKHRAAFLALIDRIEALERALGPFAAVAAHIHPKQADTDPVICRTPDRMVIAVDGVTAGDFRLARTTLSGDTK